MALSEQLAELRELVSRHARPGHPASPLKGVRLLVAQAPSPALSSISEPGFGLVVQGRKRTVLGDRLFDYGPGQYLVCPVDLPVTGHVTVATPEEPYLAVALSLKPAVIASLILEAGVRETGRGVPEMAVNGATPDLLDPLIRILHLLERPDDAAVLFPMLERELHWRLLHGAQGPALRQIGLADSRLSQIARAIAWMRANYAETPRIADLAGIAGMSLSSFHRHFRTVTAMSPLQFQKRIRLQEARARLLVSADSAAAVAFAVGYQSPSQFTREYGRLFGAPPGRDAARLRVVPPADPGLA